MSGYLPGLRDANDDVDVTEFPRERRVLRAKWWWRPICWLMRKPTEVTR